jgi:rod shape-determining protein MreD
MTGGAERYRIALVLLLLVLLHFVARPWLGDSRGSPDFLLLALMWYAIRARPGSAAIAGFVVGLIGDALTQEAFGAGILAHTVIGYVLAWGKAVFFPENLLVNAGFFLVGAWVRDLLFLLADGHLSIAAMAWQLVSWSLVKAVTTAVAGIVVVLVFRRWLEVRTAT